MKSINWLKAVAILLLQMIICLLGLYAYGIISWLVFGEAAGSLSGTRINHFFWVASPIFLASIFNIHRISTGKKENDAKVVSTYIFIATALFIVYVMFMLLVLINNGFE
jgi:amino acid permease